MVQLCAPMQHVQYHVIDMPIVLVYNPVHSQSYFIWISNYQQPPFSA